MASTVSLNGLIKKFIQSPNENNKKKLSNALELLVSRSIQQAKNNNDTNYHLYIYNNLYRPLSTKLYLNQNQLEEIIRIGDEEFNNKLVGVIHAKLKQYDFMDNKKLDLAFDQMIPEADPTAVGWHILRYGLENKNKLIHFFRAYDELQDNIDLLNEHAKKIKNQEAKNTACELVEALKNGSKDYINQAFNVYNHQKNYQHTNLTQKTNDYREKIDKAINKALPVLQTHRRNKVLRIIGNVTLCISSICTFGLALVAKGTISKYKTNEFTLFHGITQSHAYLNKINKSMINLTKAANNICRKE